MTTLREAAQQALEAWDSGAGPLREAEVFEALRAALAEPVQEPKCVAIVEVFGKDWRLEYMSLPVGRHKLYTQQYTYTTPPQRKPLSDAQMRTCCEAMDAEPLAEGWPELIKFARAIERAHGIKE